MPKAFLFVVAELGFEEDLSHEIRTLPEEQLVCFRIRKLFIIDLFEPEMPRYVTVR